MAYNFLGLVNDINRSLNEVELTSGNFASSIGFYNQAKNSVNFAIQALNQENFEWPFNHVTNTVVLTPYQSRYNFPTGALSINYDTFRVIRDDALNVETRKLFSMDYEDYLEKYLEYEHDSTDRSDNPLVVSRSPNLQWIIAPPPDQAYTVKFESYSTPSFMEDWDDVPSVPEGFRYVINEGSMSFAYRFRGDLEMADFSENKFKQAVKQMRSIYTNRTEYLRSTMVR